MPSMPELGDTPSTSITGKIRLGDGDAVTEYELLLDTLPDILPDRELVAVEDMDEKRDADADCAGVTEADTELVNEGEADAAGDTDAL